MMIEKLKNLSRHPIISKIDFLQKEIEKFKPLSEENYNRIMNKFRLEWNYNSNAIEGNKLNYGETVAFLKHGITAKGKPLKDHLDIRGHNEGINFMLDIIKNNRPFNESDIRSLHEIVLVEPYETNAITPDGVPVKKRISLGKYKTLPNHVRTITGEMHYYATPEETPAKMEELMKWYAEADKDVSIHPLALASVFHHRFVSVHPFDDGNGRVARILMNLILMRNNFPPLVIKMTNRETYYGVLAQADAGDDTSLIEFMGEGLINSLEIYLRGAKGEELNDPDDIDKEIELFKMNFNKSDVIQNELNKSILIDIIKITIIPIYELLKIKTDKLSDLFIGTNFKFHGTILSHGVAGKNPDIIISQINSLGLENEIKKAQINLSFELRGFKKQSETFNVTREINFIFSEFNYKITLTGLLGKVNLPMMYDENLKEKDISEIVTLLIKSVLKEIEEKRIK